MEIKNPELYKFVMSLGEEFQGFKKQYDEDNVVELVNGKIETVKLKKAISMIHDEVKIQSTKIDRIGVDTQILRDWSGFFSFMRKYHLWWAVGIVISITLSALGLDVALNTIKNHLP